MHVLRVRGTASERVRARERGWGGRERGCVLGQGSLELLYMQHEQVSWTEQGGMEGMEKGGRNGGTERCQREKVCERERVRQREERK